MGCVKMDSRWDMVVEMQEFKNVPDFYLVQNTARKKIFENYSELNLSKIIESGEEAIKKISNISNIAEAAEQVIGDAAEILNIIPAKDDSDGSNYDYQYEELLSKM